MPKYEGVYKHANGGWYFKAWFGRDPLTGKKNQVTRRGFATAGEAARARRVFLEQVTSGHGLIPTGHASMSVNELMDWYLDGLDSDERLSPKTRFDYRVNTDSYIRPWLGSKPVRNVTPEVIIRWQRKLQSEGGRKNNQGLSANTVRLARWAIRGLADDGPVVLRLKA